MRYEIKVSCLYLSLNYFDSPALVYTIETNCIELQAADSEMCSILIFLEKGVGLFLHHILCMVF